MRQYAILTPQRWIGNTGKKLRRSIQQRERGDPQREVYKDAQILMDVLIAGPSANKYGLYYVSIASLADLTGLAVDEVAAAMVILGQEDVASYDETSEFVWVKEAARLQMFLPLKPGDRNVGPAQAWYRQLPRNPFLGPFFDRYRYDLRLEERRDEWRAERLPMESSAEPQRAAPLPPRQRGVLDLMFQVFLESYPSQRRVGGELGLAAFRKAMQDRDPEQHLAVMCESLFWQKRSKQWRDGVIPGMTKWLDEEQWARDLPRDKKVGNWDDPDCEHGCSGPGQHALRLELDRVCQHEPSCTSFVEHWNKGVEVRDAAALG